MKTQQLSIRVVVSISLILGLMAVDSGIASPSSLAEALAVIRQDCSGYPGPEPCYTSLAAWRADYGGIDFGAAQPGDQTPLISSMPADTRTYTLASIQTPGERPARLPLIFSRPIAPIVPTFETGKQPAFEIHVAVDGHDGTGDGSAANPYTSIERAAQDAAPGAAIRLHAGAYTGGTYLQDLIGTEVAPIWIGGVLGEARPVIEGGSEGIHLVRVRYVIVHDLEVRNAAYNGINTDDGGDFANPNATRHILFRDLNIHHIGDGGNEDCLKLSGVNDYFVLNSEFAFCGGGGSGSGIDHVGCHYGLIVGNFFHDLSANAVQNKGGSQDIEIRANYMLNAGYRAVNIGGSTGYEYFRPPLSTSQLNFEARDIRVIANVIEGGETPFAFVGAVDSLAANNTIIDPENWLLRILQETVSDGAYEFLPSGDNTVVNNLFYFDRSNLSTFVNIGPNTAPETFTFSNNLWYAHDDPAQSQPILPVSEADGVVGQNPMFQDPVGGDYHLQSGSPAVGQGAPVAGVTSDYDGLAYNVPPSIGAFEGNRLSFSHHLYLPWVAR